MGQIPHSTERISSFFVRLTTYCKYMKVLFVNADKDESVLNKKNGSQKAVGRPADVG